MTNFHLLDLKIKLSDKLTEDDNKNYLSQDNALKLCFFLTK